MSVSSATVGSPAPPATSTSARASSSASARAAMNAPEPNLTSITSASSPAASFLERIEATISGIDSTVPVASRIAYSRRSAGREVRGLADDRAAGPADDAAQLLDPGRRVVARHGVELVQRPARVAEPAAGDHRHGAAAGGDDRREHQRDLVADAAGGVLVEHGRGRGPSDHGARVAHRLGQRDPLAGVHPAQEQRHRQRADLRVGQPAVRDPVDEEGDLLAASAPRRRACGGSPRRGAASCASASQKRSTSRARSPAAAAAYRSVCSCESASPPMPSARFVIAETAATRRPQWRARITSGTVDMPTASAPSVRKARISAGVSKLGPVRGEVDALGQRDAELAGAAAQQRRAAPGRRRRACSGSAGRRRRRWARERVDAEHVDVVGDRHQRARRRLRAQRAGGVGGQQRGGAGALAARAPARASRRGRRPRRCACGPAGTRRAARRAGRARAGRRGRPRRARGKPGRSPYSISTASSAASASPPRPEPRTSPSAAEAGARRAITFAAASPRATPGRCRARHGSWQVLRAEGARQQLLEGHRRAGPLSRAGGRWRRAA